MTYPTQYLFWHSNCIFIANLHFDHLSVVWQSFLNKFPQRFLVWPFVFPLKEAWTIKFVIHVCHKSYFVSWYFHVELLTNAFHFNLCYSIWIDSVKMLITWLYLDKNKKRYMQHFMTFAIKIKIPSISSQNLRFSF